ncbi:substrate-binding domain-containing protein [bacterium]|nr:substrate-binding domain-containing protein [bacterium]
MKESLIKIIKTHGFIAAAFIWTVLCLLLTVFTFSRIYTMRAPGAASILMAVFNVAALIIAAVLFVREYRLRILPFRRLEQSGHDLSDRDFPALARGLSNLTLGSLKQKLHLHSDYPPANVPRKLLPVAETLHILRDNLGAIIDDFNSITDVPCKRLAFIGTDPIADGQKSAQLMSEMLGNKGKVLIATGFRFNAMLELRQKSFHSWLVQNTHVEVIDIFESMMNREFGLMAVEDILDSTPGLKGIYATDPVTTFIVAEAVSLKKKDDIVIIGHDLTLQNIQHLKSGTIDALLDQSAYVQGYDSVMNLYNHLVEGWIPPKPQIFIPATVITTNNLQKYWHHLTQKILVPREIHDSLTVPAGTPPTRNYRIVALGRDDSEIWKHVHDGVMAAHDKLTVQNIHIDWIVPEETREKSDFSAMVYGRHIETLIAERVDGIITFIEDARLIAFINKAVDAGIPVVTVNTEPLNLRSLIQMLNEQAGRLSKISKDLAGTTQHVIISTTEIRNSISNIADGSMAQNKQVEKTRSTLESLLNSIDQINREASESEQSSENTNQAVLSGTKAIEKTFNTLKSISESVSSSWHTVEELRQHSNRIDDIVNILNNIASKVNILALNASIEATQSGIHEGRFGQVASEIRKLAMSTSEANREVAILIDTLKSDIQQVAKTMQSSLELIQDSREFTGETDTALETIQMLVESDRTRIQQISNAINAMQSMSHQVGYSMDQVAMASGRNTSSVNQVNVTIKEMGMRLESIRKLARQLEQMALSESDFLAMFDIDEEKN